MRSLVLDGVDLRDGGLECHGRFPDPKSGKVVSARINFHRIDGLDIHPESGRTTPSVRATLEASGPDFVRSLELYQNERRHLISTHGKAVGLRIYSTVLITEHPPLSATGDFALRVHAKAREMEGGFDFYLESNGSPRVFAQPLIVHTTPTGPGIIAIEFTERYAMEDHPVEETSMNVPALAAMLSEDPADAAVQAAAIDIDRALRDLAPGLIALGRALIATLTA